MNILVFASVFIEKKYSHRRRTGLSPISLFYYCAISFRIRSKAPEQKGPAAENLKRFKFFLYTDFYYIVFCLNKNKIPRKINSKNRTPLENSYIYILYRTCASSTDSDELVCVLKSKALFYKLSYVSCLYSFYLHNGRPIFESECAIFK